MAESLLDRVAVLEAALTMTAAVNSIPREALRPAPQIAVRANGRGEAPMIAVIARMSAQTGAPPTRLLGEFAALSFGPGRLSFTDYTQLRLYDDDFWDGVDKKTVVGHRRGGEICHWVNQSPSVSGLYSNTLAASAYLAAFGFPVPPVVALFAKGLASPAPNLLRGRGELRQFLTGDAPYPLFARPMDGGPGAAAGALYACDGASGMLELAGGRHTPLDNFIDDVSEHGRYLFQPLLTSHASVAALAGSRPASVRLVTLTTDQEPHLARACWRLPVGEAAGRGSSGRGDLLARLDLRSGAVLRATLGLGPDLEEITRHPVTGARLIGAVVPGWEALKATTIEAARVMRPMTMIGWEIVPCDTGPVIVGVSDTPDLATQQLVDRRGLLDTQMTALIADRRHASGDRAELPRL